MGKPPATESSTKTSPEIAVVAALGEVQQAQAVDAEPVPDLTLKGLSRPVTAFNVRAVTLG